jgi:hypothetical protein
MKGVLMGVWGAFAEAVVAIHSNVFPGTAGTAEGQTTVALRWRLANMVCSIDSATRAVSTFVFAAVLSLEELLEEPQALNRTAHASAVVAKASPRRGDTAWVLLGLGRSICMQTY